jgi:hypothetical protein
MWKGGGVDGEDDFGNEFDLLGEDDDGPEAGALVFQLGGRLDLPEGFAAAPVRLASRAELAVAAWASPAVARLAAFVSWVGKGRQLADDELSASDARELASILGVEAREVLNDEAGQMPDQAEAWLVLEWALLAGFVVQRGRKLFRTARGREMGADPMATWEAAFEALMELAWSTLKATVPPGATPSTAPCPITSCSPTSAVNPSRSARCWSGCGGKRTTFAPSIPVTRT